MMKINSKTWLITAFVFLGVAVFAMPGSPDASNAETVKLESTNSKPLLQVFYKEKEPSMQTLKKVKDFLKTYEGSYDIQYLLITNPENEDTIKSLKLPIEHFPFAIAINGKTSAKIDGKTIIFAHFPDFMHHIGKHQGNWTLDHLAKALKDTSLMSPENPVVITKPGGK